MTKGTLDVAVRLATHVLTLLLVALAVVGIVGNAVLEVLR